MVHKNIVSFMHKALDFVHKDRCNNVQKSAYAI